MAEADRAMRNSAIKNFSHWDASLDKKHTAALKRLVRQHGWPTISLVGQKAANAAWLLAQHADHDPEFQESCLAMMKALPQKEIIPKDIAYLTDRVLVARGQPQLYGTQFWDYGDGLEPRPIQNESELDQRRKRMGLGSFTEYVKEHYKLYGKL